MLTDSKNAALYTEWHKSITDPQVQAAFHYIVGAAARLEEYQCHIQWKGKVRDFRFHDTGGEQPFSFITNNRWLLFYLRPPAIRSGTFSRNELENLFDSVAENSAGEWTVRLRSIPDVERLIRFLGW